MSKGCTPHFNELMAARGGKGSEGDGHPGFKGGKNDRGESTYVDQPQTRSGAAKPGKSKRAGE